MEMVFEEKYETGISQKEIRVLFAEDSMDDYELVVSIMKRSGLNVMSKRVETPDDFKLALESENWHMIISDNSLPKFNAKEALRITRKLRPHLPFIIVSGTIGEETAVEAMRMGADDYILKDNLARLIPAIKRELEDYQNQVKMEQTQMLLDKSRQYYQLLAQYVQDLVCVHNSQGSYSWVSPSCVRMLGYTPEKMIKESPFANIHPEDVFNIQEMIFKPMIRNELNGLQRFRYRMRRKDGAYIHLETLAEPIYKDNKLYKIVSTSRDVTEQVLASELLEENQAKYESVLECMSEGIVLVGMDEGILTFNKSAKDFLELKDLDKRQFSEIVFGNFLLFDEDNKRLKVEDFLTKETMKLKGTPQYNKVYRLRNQYNEKWFSFNCVPYMIQDKQIGAVVSFKDVSESFESKKKLNRLAQELVNLVETANAPIFGINKEGTITEWNNFSSDITGYSKSEAIGKNIFEDLILPEDHGKIREFISKILSNNITSNCELSLITKAGQIVTVLFSGNIKRDFDNNITGIVCVCQDITELIDYREQLEYKVEERTKKLKLALEKEKELVQLKSKFVSMASHEFRTPLSTIKFSSDYIKKYHDKVDWNKLDEKLSKIDEQVNHMAYLLDDVLTMGKSEAGKIKVEYNGLNLKSFCQNLIIEIENLCNKSHEIEFRFSSPQEEILSDEKLLRNILTNLLSNAVKFSPERDKVKLSILIKNELITLTVEDKGMGIPKKDREQIFEAFHRSEQVASIQGTGLGLSIMKKAVELLNGTIEFESEENKGTKFIIKLPVINEKNSTN